MPKIEDIPTVAAQVSIVHIRPTIISTSVCPHCEFVNGVEIEKGQENKTLLHSCVMCDKNYKVRHRKTK